MLKGIIRDRHRLQDSAEALNEAALFGQVEGYPLTILAQMLDVYETKSPSASQIASITWRRTVLERLIPYYAWPRQLVAMLRGTLIHHGLEKANFPLTVRTMREKRLRVELPHHPDRALSGQIDIYFPEYRRLEDYKTCQQVPNAIKEEHLFQLAVYYWLLKWSGYEVDKVAIDYIAWDEMRQVTVAELPGKSVQEAVNHTYFQDEQAFEKLIVEGWDILDAGFQANVVPSMQNCNLNYCRYCPLKWACDRISVDGGVIVPEEFRQEDYM